MDTLSVTDAAAAEVATAARVSKADIEHKIAARYDFPADAAAASLGSPVHPSLALLSICILVMRNGYTVIGKSAPASPENFNQQLGQRLAYEDAFRQIWPLEGYLLREAVTDHAAGKIVTTREQLACSLADWSAPERPEGWPVYDLDHFEGALAKADLDKADHVIRYLGVPLANRI